MHAKCLPRPAPHLAPRLPATACHAGEVSIQISGWDGSTEVIKLPSVPKKSFRRAGVDTFPLVLDDCGHISSMTVTMVWGGGGRAGGGGPGT